MSVQPPTAPPLVLFKRIGAIALITLNRPKAHNALNAERVVKLIAPWGRHNGRTWACTCKR
ncbi:hypothetical protein [Pseudomonas sp. 25 R 14]|nr:hypothetical protein [Pseudomonas sp. 25 R 14]